MFSKQPQLRVFPPLEGLNSKKIEQLQHYSGHTYVNIHKLN